MALAGMTSRGRWAISVCLALILIYPAYSVRVQSSYQELAPTLGKTGARLLTEGAIWAYAVTVVGIALRGEPRTLAAMGVRWPTWATLGFGLVGAVIMFVAGQGAGYLVYTVLQAPARADAQAAAIVGGSVAYAVCLAIRAGVVEETLFRGLAIEKLATLTGSRWLAAGISMIAFVLVHALRFDWAQLYPLAAVALVLTGLYLWRRDLLANTVAHVLLDGVGLVTAALQHL